jgi:hypothetical protein
MRANCCVRFFERPSSTATWASVQSKHVEVPVEFNFVSNLSIAASSLYQRRIRIRSLLISIGSSRRMISELHRLASDKDLMGPDGTNWTDAYTTFGGLGTGPTGSLEPSTGSRPIPGGHTREQGENSFATT